MRRKTWVVMGAAAIVAIAGQTNVSAQPTGARVQAWIQGAGQATGQTRPSPPTSSPSAPASADQPVVHLSLDDAVKLALDRNLDIAVQRLTPSTYDYQIAGLAAVYLPAFTGTIGSATTENPPISIASGNTTTDTYAAGLSQAVRWGGASVLVGFNGAKNTSTSAFQLYNPAYNTSYFAQYTQPLMRGFRTDSTRQQLIVTKLNQDVSEIQLRSTIVNTLSNVREAYWNFVYAVQSVEVAKQSVELSEQLVKDNQVRVQVGTMAPIDVVQAQSQAAADRRALVVAQGQKRTAELALKRLVVSGTQDPNWNATIDPTDRPDFRPEPVDLEAAIRRALAARTDVAQAMKTVEANNTTLKFIKDQALPQADVVLRYGGTGLAGTQLIRSGGLSSPVIGTNVTGFPASLSSLFSYPQWSATLNLSYPIGTNAARASVARAKVQVNQAEAQIHQIELQVATDVTNAVIAVQSALESTQAAQAARELAQRNLEAEQTKFQVGMSTNYFVVQAQRDLATAQNSELQSTLNYRNSLVELDRLQQTTLQVSGVTVLSTAGLNTSAVGSGRPTIIVQ